MTNNIRVRREESSKAGSCNGCSSFTDPETSITKEHTVNVISINTTQIRLCDKCSKKLLDSLGSCLEVEKYKKANNSEKWLKKMLEIDDTGCIAAGGSFPETPENE